MKTSCNYTAYTVSCEAKRLLLVTDIHSCHIKWHELENGERMTLLCKALNEEHKKQPYDAILSLGDYSLDFWGWNNGGSYLKDPPVSNTEEFVKKYVSQMPTNFYIIPGNHEQYGNETWRKIVGTPREYVVVYGDYVFVMLDTFAGNLDPKEHHDGVYTGVNTSLLSAVIKDYPDKKIILCAHDISLPSESEKLREMILEHKQIICAFVGHTHKDNTLILPDSWRHLPVFYCGDFSYSGKDGGAKNWGYRVLDLSNAAISTEYVKAKD